MLVLWPRVTPKVAGPNTTVAGLYVLTAGYCYDQVRPGIRGEREVGGFLHKYR